VRAALETPNPKAPTLVSPLAAASGGGGARSLKAEGQAVVPPAPLLRAGGGESAGGEERRRSEGRRTAQRWGSRLGLAGPAHCSGGAAHLGLI
jgi:hypothetical protein